jgi:hypothetical protein
MTSTVNLDRILKKNTAVKVKQLSEIAVLFEQEQRINKQLLEIEKLQVNLESEIDCSGDFSKELPRNFLERENKKRKKLLETIRSHKIDAVKESEEIEFQKKKEALSLKKTDIRIKHVEGTLKEKRKYFDAAKEVIETEELLKNV